MTEEEAIDPDFFSTYAVDLREILKEYVPSKYTTLKDACKAYTDDKEFQKEIDTKLKEE
jgi:hypothetical protein